MDPKDEPRGAASFSRTITTRNAVFCLPSNGRTSHGLHPGLEKLRMGRATGISFTISNGIQEELGTDAHKPP